MARSNDIQYVRYYTSGSAARQVELPEKKRAKPQPRPQIRKTVQPGLHLDVLAVTAVAVAAVMVICLVIGCVQVSYASAEVSRLEAYVADLQAQNESLRLEYENGYDLTEIRIAAESMGMIPEQQAQHITVAVPAPAAEQADSWWENLLEDFKALFA